jgi:hypothetical protein
MTNIKITDKIEEPGLLRILPNYAKEALRDLTFPVDKSAPKQPGKYPVKKEELIKALEGERKDLIALGWWRENSWPWPPEESLHNWVYFPEECCKKERRIKWEKLLTWKRWA